eukprot:gene462-1868_t
MPQLNEVVSLVRMGLAAKQAARLPSDPDLAFCYDMLNRVSRSFALVIQQLPNPLRDAICIFYLVLRGLDTVEDDMAIEVKDKLPDLLAFHEYIYDRGFHMDHCGYNHYKRLMVEFGTVVEVFLRLDKPFQDVIADITKRMGAGMAEFIEKEVKTVADYDKYCHYVAGLVGIGLSDLFASSGLEAEADEFANMHDLSNHMGLFLQKTNIIRDYLEDILEEPAPRMFWPSAIWGKYGQQLSDFKEVSNRDSAIQCLNHMITDAMRHLPFSIEYMSKVRDVQVFRFCAIPQIMAIATLAMCYNNGKVFEDLRKAVSSSIQLCQGNLDQKYHGNTHEGAFAAPWRRDNPSTTVWPLLMDLCALAGSGTYAFYALNLGGSHTAQPEIGQMLGIGSSGPLQTAHVLLSVLLLVLLSLRLIFVAR